MGSGVKREFQLNDKVNFLGPVLIMETSPHFLPDSLTIARGNIDWVVKPIEGVIIDFVKDGLLHIKTKWEAVYRVHPRQCRRIVPKKRRSVWVNMAHHVARFGTSDLEIFGEPFLSYSEKNGKGWAEFREVVLK